VGFLQPISVSNAELQNVNQLLRTYLRKSNRKITCIPRGQQNKFGTKTTTQNKFGTKTQNKFGTKTTTQNKFGTKNHCCQFRYMAPFD